MIEEDVCKILRKEIAQIKPENNGEIDIEMIQDIISKDKYPRDPSFYLEQPPDTSPENIDSDSKLLGSYSHMSSPGKIVLYRKNLHGFFWSIVRNILANNWSIRVTTNDLHCTADLIVMKTFRHEQFHFCCDVFRHLFLSRFDRMTEEALAVAFSRQKILKYRQDGRTTIAKIQPYFYELVMEIAFAYTSPGYKDWGKYADPMIFDNKLVQYGMNNGGVLASNGVDLPSLLKGIIERLLSTGGGYVEEVA